MPERNIVLLERLRFRLVNESKSHDQSSWATVRLEGKFPENTAGIAVSCATTSCAAGTTCLLLGDSFFVKTPYPYMLIYYADSVIDTQGRTHKIPKRARKALGLTTKEARILFYGDHTREQTIELLDRLIAGKKIRWYDDDEERDWDMDA